MDASENRHDTSRAFDFTDLATTSPAVAASKQKPRTKPGSSSRSSASSALKTEQENRKFRSITEPSPDLSIPLNQFPELTACLKSSKRIFALIGAGLSAPSGITTYRGDDCRLWRSIEPQTLRNIESFWKFPMFVWWLFSDRMRGAREASPNRGHVALAKLAAVKKGFFAVNRNIDDESRNPLRTQVITLMLLAGLCQRAGFPASQLAQIHGTMFEVKCSRNIQSHSDTCTYTTPASYPISLAFTIRSPIDISDPSIPLPPLLRSQFPHYPLCASLLCPAVVHFGESTPRSTTDAIWNFKSAAPID